MICEVGVLASPERIDNGNICHLQVVTELVFLFFF